MRQNPVGARTPRNNCLTPMKVEATCPAHPRLPINELLNSNFWQHRVSSSRPLRRCAYQRLLAPEGRFYVMGDQVSPLSGWIEGAFMSSEHAVLQITGKRPTLVSEMQRSPDALRMMGGVG